ncbi:MAG: protein phosphatase 2C domain-containing protein [Candidatus Krumholzibacteria bacterium]|nr:protein phosphatase 2C domain-containing protein [Candidatus Krumholzibacteria bacterium]
MRTVTIAGASDPGCVRAENQDRYLIDRVVAQSMRWCLSVSADDPVFARDGMLCAVADGMGGHRGGAEASRVALETLAGADGGGRDANGAWISRLILEAHGKILEMSEADPELRGMGTTVVGAHLSTGSCIVFHAGDSRLYRLRDGYLNLLTEDHAVPQVSQAGGMAPAARSTVLTNCIGGGSPVCRPAIRGDVSFRAGDALLLCSDGLTDAVSDIAALETILSARRSAQEAVGALIGAARGAGGPDNITVVVVEGA